MGQYSFDDVRSDAHFSEIGSERAAKVVKCERPHVFPELLIKRCLGFAEAVKRARLTSRERDNRPWVDL